MWEAQTSKDMLFSHYKSQTSEGKQQTLHSWGSEATSGGRAPGDYLKDKYIAAFTLYKQLPGRTFIVCQSFIKRNLENLHRSCWKSLGSMVVIHKSTLKESIGVVFFLFFFCFLVLVEAFKGVCVVEQRLMGVVHPSSEGVPGGLSADGQRRRMAGCGAPSSNASRLSPSSPRTSPAKSLRRYSTASPLFLCSLLLFLHLSSPSSVQKTASLTCTSHKHAQPE